MLIDLSSWYKSSLAPKIEAIQNAMEQHRIVHSTYDAPKGTSVRSVEPYYLVFHWVHMVSVGLVSNPAGLPPVQAQPHDRSFYRRSLYTTPSPFTGSGPGADLSHAISGVRPICPVLPLAAGGRIRC